MNKYEEKLARIKALLSGETQEEKPEQEATPAPQYVSVEMFEQFKAEQEQKISEGFQILSEMIQDMVKEQKEVPVAASAEEVVDVAKDPNEVIEDTKGDVQLLEEGVQLSEDNEPAAEEIVSAPSELDAKSRGSVMASLRKHANTVDRVWEILNN